MSEAAVAMEAQRQIESLYRNLYDAERLIEELERQRDQAHEELRRRRRARVTDSEYERVAQVYRDAVAAGHSAQHAVKDAFTVSQSRAAALIGEARKRGLLPPTTPGKAKA